MRKKGKNIVKNAFVKLDETKPLTLTINDSFQKFSCLCIIHIDYK
jgi:hypothetical protein